MSIINRASVTFVVCWFVCPLLHAQNFSDLESRGKEIQQLTVLACDSANATPRTAGYKSDLAAAIGELRSQLPEAKEALSRSSLLAPARPALMQIIDSQMAALSDSDTCKAAQAFAALPPAAAQPASPSPDFVVSKSSISFAEKEPGETDSAAFRLTNQAKGSIGVGVPNVFECAQSVCDCEDPKSDTKCWRPTHNFSVKAAGEGCPNPLSQAANCDFTATFTPRWAGDFRARVEIPITDSQGKQSKATLPLTAVSHVTDIANLSNGASGPTFRSVVGFDISGASSASTQQKAFVEFGLMAPLGWGKIPVCQKQEKLKLAKSTGGKSTGSDSGYSCPEEPGWDLRWWSHDPLSRTFWVYFNPRITSLPQSATALNNLNLAGSTDIFQVKNTDLVQGIDVSGGVDITFLKPRNGIPFFSSYRNFHARMGLALVFGLGVTSPFSTQQTNPTVFSLGSGSGGTFTPVNATAQGLINQFNIDTTKFSNIAFLEKERSRFFRRYQAGLRFKSYHFSSLQKSYFCDPVEVEDVRCEAVKNQFPGIIDITVGQDELVTGGHLHHWVFRLDAVYPLPFLNGFTIFGSTSTALERNRTSAPLVLPVNSTTALADPSVFVAQVDPRNRDIYRIGVGIDIVQLIRKSAQTKIQDSAKSPGSTPVP